ncbi:MAG: DUF5522 domain-containing protein [Polyangiaceae bacterium]
MATPRLKLGQDYYLEEGKMVLLPSYLLRRGYCCNSGCRHCPYRPAEEVAKASGLPTGLRVLGLDDD